MWLLFLKIDNKSRLRCGINITAFANQNEPLLPEVCMYEDFFLISTENHLRQQTLKAEKVRELSWDQEAFPKKPEFLSPILVRHKTKANKTKQTRTVKGADICSGLFHHHHASCSWLHYGHLDAVGELNIQ